MKNMNGATVPGTAMKDLLKELNSVSETVTGILKSDGYCRDIKPDFLRESVADYPLRAGKRLRPALLFWSCGLLGGDLEKAEYAAAAVEVYHNWTLVHDDIIDNDEIRRGKPTAHIKLSGFGKKEYGLGNVKAVKYGTDFAILTGDLQNSWANSLLLKSLESGVSPDVLLSLCRDLFDSTTNELITGEALDVNFSYISIDSLSLREVERMIYLKTGVLLKFCVVAGAKIALKTSNSNDARIKGLVKFAAALGSAFQLRDDWLGIYGKTEKFGKPAGSDICSAKPTVLVLETLKRVGVKSKKRLLSYLGKPVIGQKELDDVRNIITGSGAEEAVLDRVSSLKNEAEKALLDYPDNKYRKLLSALNDYLVTREA